MITVAHITLRWHSRLNTRHGGKAPQNHNVIDDEAKSVDLVGALMISWKLLYDESLHAGN